MAYKSALSMGGPEPGEDQKGSAMAHTSSASEGVPNDEAMATASAGREEMASKLVHRICTRVRRRRIGPAARRRRHCRRRTTGADAAPAFADLRCRVLGKSR